ncbi:MAG: hypothetical protein ACRC1H_14790, partial [Caldilineaceae bacterium]
MDQASIAVGTERVRAWIRANLESISAPATWPSSFQLDGSAPQYRDPIGELQLTAALHADRVTETRLQQTADGLTCT